MRNNPNFFLEEAPEEKQLAADALQEAIALYTDEENKTYEKQRSTQLLKMAKSLIPVRNSVRFIRNKKLRVARSEGEPSNPLYS